MTFKQLLFRMKKGISECLPTFIIEAYLRFRWIFYVGNRFECPFCNNQFRRMVHGGCLEQVCRDKQITGMYYHDNMTCPKCGAIDRWRLIYLYLVNYTEIFKKPLSVLHIAPELAIQKKITAMKERAYLSIDLENPSAMQFMDIREMSIADSSFDVVLCSHVLEHIPEDIQAMAEIYRVLRPSGFALLQVPISLTLSKTYENESITLPKQRRKEFGQVDHVRIYAKDFSDRMKSVGFDVEVKIVSSIFSSEVIHKFALDPDEHIFLGEKAEL